MRQVADFVLFLKFRARIRIKLLLDEKQLASLYAEFADEDRKLAESGITDYFDSLAKEDSR